MSEAQSAKPVVHCSAEEFAYEVTFRVLAPIERNSPEHASFFHTFVGPDG